jgi:hypothetical protein
MEVGLENLACRDSDAGDVVLPWLLGDDDRQAKRIRDKKQKGCCVNDPFLVSRDRGERNCLDVCR